jgi:hypothetical protein
MKQLRFLGKIKTSQPMQFREQFHSQAEHASTLTRSTITKAT